MVYLGWTAYIFLQGAFLKYFKCAQYGRSVSSGNIAAFSFDSIPCFKPNSGLQQLYTANTFGMILHESSMTWSCMKAAWPWEAKWRQSETGYFSHSMAIYTHMPHTNPALLLLNILCNSTWYPFAQVPLQRNLVTFYDFICNIIKISKIITVWIHTFCTGSATSQSHDISPHYSNTN